MNEIFRPDGTEKPLDTEALDGGGTRYRTEYSDDEDATLALKVRKRDGGDIILPLFEHALTTEEHNDGPQDNTLLSIRPLAVVAGDADRPGGASLKTAMLRPGWLYVFFRGQLWRELEVDDQGRLSDVDVPHHRARASAGDVPNQRASEGRWFASLLIPVLLQRQVVASDVRLAYSEVAWSWPYIAWLEANPRRLDARSVPMQNAYIAYATLLADPGHPYCLSQGFPAGPVSAAPPCRQRELGVELMLQHPHAFVPDFTVPDDTHLCMRLKTLWEDAGERERAAALALDIDAGEDLLADQRGYARRIAVALPDPLFALRHALAQIQLAEHYLDGLDSQLARKPLGHSAKLIRQALYAPLEDGVENPLAKYRGTLDTARLDEVLDQRERDAAITLLREQIATLDGLLADGSLVAVLRDFTSHHQLAICEGYALFADLFGALQQLPEMLRDQGEAALGNEIVALLSRLLSDPGLQAIWGVQESDYADALRDDEARGDGNDDSEENDGSGRLRPGFLRRLAEDDSDIDDDRARDLGLESLGLIARHLTTQEWEAQDSVLSVANATKVGGLITTVVGQWSQAVLRVAERVANDVEVVQLRRVFVAASGHANLVDGALQGELRVMPRGEVDFERYVIVGVHGDGINWGLTDRDRDSGAMQTQNDYLYAEQIDADGQTRASSSPTRMSEEVDGAIRRVAGHTLVFVLPVGHPQADNLSQLRLAKIADRVKVVVDGPAVSRLLVGFAIYNLGREMAGLSEAARDNRLGMQYMSIISTATDLSAASMKLHTALYPQSTSPMGRFVQRPLFDLKNFPVAGRFIARQLERQGGSSIVRSLGLANFLAGAMMVGVSGWELRNSLRRGEGNAALGHGVAIAGGILFMTAPLVAGLVLIPGWGLVLLGLGLAIGGTSYAAMNQDTPFEALLRQGPLGTHPRADISSDHAYFPQLLTLLSPVAIDVTRYAELGDDARQALLASVWDDSNDTPSPRDYVVTLATPLISRYRVGDSLRLVVQEMRHIDTQEPANHLLGTPVQQAYLFRQAEPFEIGRRQLLPDGAVRFLVKRRVHEEVVDLGGGASITSTAQLRVALQARIDSELGAVVLPTPLLSAYEPYDAQRHTTPPDRGGGLTDSRIVAWLEGVLGRDRTPAYWHIEELHV